MIFLAKIDIEFQISKICASNNVIKLVILISSNVLVASIENRLKTHDTSICAYFWHLNWYLKDINIISGQFNICKILQK